MIIDVKISFAFPVGVQEIGDGHQVALLFSQSLAPSTWNLLISQRSAKTLNTNRRYVFYLFIYFISR